MTSVYLSPRFERVRRPAVMLLALAACFAASAGSITATAAPPDINVFATVPDPPGFPEGVVVDCDRVYVSGPARFGTAGTGPSAIRIYERSTGQLETTIFVSGENLAFEHALSNMAVDHQGRVYALSTQLGLIRFRKQGNAFVQEPYGDPLPQIISPMIPPIPNDVVFDADGNAYVSDSLQATIFRYPPGGGAPQVWFQSPKFVGGGPIPFGTNGLRLDPKRKYLYIAVSTSQAVPSTGTIYRLKLQESPAPKDLKVFHVYDNSELPDQLAFATDGKLYVSLAQSNQISVLNKGGHEIARFGSSPGDPIPLDAPAGLAFDAKSESLLIVNHALLSMNPAHFAVLKVNVGDPGDPLERPTLP